MFLLGQVEKTYKLEKVKEARHLLLHQALEGGSLCMQAVQKFKEDPSVMEVFRSVAKCLIQGRISRSRYNSCLGLLTARLMYW